MNESTTTNSLLANIIPTVGENNNFEIYCNGVRMTTVTERGSSHTISNLKAGESYDCHAKSFFCNHTSAESNIVTECTGWHEETKPNLNTINIFSLQIC